MDHNDKCARKKGPRFDKKLKERGAKRSAGAARSQKVDLREGTLECPSSPNHYKKVSPKEYRRKKTGQRQHSYRKTYRLIRSGPAEKKSGGTGVRGQQTDLSTCTCRVSQGCKKRKDKKD